MKTKQAHKQTKQLKYDFSKSCHFMQTGISQICAVSMKIPLVVKFEWLTIFFNNLKIFFAGWVFQTSS